MASPSSPESPTRQLPKGVVQLRKKIQNSVRKIVLRIAPPKPSATPHLDGHRCYVRLIYGFEAARSNVGRWQKRCIDCPFVAWISDPLPETILESEGISAHLDRLDALRPIPRSSPHSVHTPASASPQRSDAGLAHGTPNGRRLGSSDAPPPYPADSSLRKQTGGTLPPPSHSPSTIAPLGSNYQPAIITVLFWLLPNDGPLKFECRGRPGGHFALVDNDQIQQYFPDDRDILLETYEAAVQGWEGGHTLSTVRPVRHGEILLYRTKVLEISECTGLATQVTIVTRMHQDAVLAQFHTVRVSRDAIASQKAAGHSSQLTSHCGFQNKRNLIISDSEDGEELTLPVASQKRRKTNHTGGRNNAYEVIIISDSD